MRDLREYFRPESAQEAVALKSRYGPRAVYLGGATDLLVHRPRGVEAAIDIRHAGISGVSEEEDGWHVGGGALLCEIERSAARVAGGMFRRAVRETAPWLIRNSATLAGNVANASPAADAVPALLALDARLQLLGGGDESVALSDVLVGPHRTSLGDRLIREIRIPAEAAARSGAFIKLARSKSDIAQVNIAVTLRRDDGVARDVRIALGAVAPTALRARRAEAMLEGRAPDDDTLHEVARTVQEEVMPISDWRAPAEYRRRMCGVLVRRAVRGAFDESPGGADA